MPYILLCNKNKVTAQSLTDEITREAITRFERDDHYHAQILTDANTILESVDVAGVRERPATPDDYAVADKYSVDGATDAVWVEAIRFFRAQIGAPYGYQTDIDFITHRPATMDGTWECAEIVNEAFQHQMFNLLARIQSWAVSPRDLNISTKLIGPL